mgnify:CR=1 FL=1
MKKKVHLTTEECHAKGASQIPEETFGLIIRRTYQAFMRALEKRILPYGITTPQWFFLRELWEGEGTSQRELSEKVGIAESTTVAAIKVLERRGLVLSINEKSDRRRKNVILTEAGRDLVTALLPQARLVYMIAMEGISEELMQSTEDAIGHMKRNLEAGEETRLLLKEIRNLTKRLEEDQNSS